MLSPVWLYVYNESGFPIEVCTFVIPWDVLFYFVNIWVIFCEKKVVLYCFSLEISYVIGTLPRGLRIVRNMIVK
jgi:hypothetical protein